MMEDCQPPRPLCPIQPVAPLDIVASDIVNISNVSEKMPYIIVFQDYFTKYLEAALSPDTSVASIVDTFSTNCRHYLITTIEEGHKIKADIRQHLECLKIDEKVVKGIIGDGLTPGAKHRNHIALGTLVIQAPHSLSNKTMDYMYNQFNIVPIIFEETRRKRPAKGDKITIDKHYQEDCWFFETKCCQWEGMSLHDPFLLTAYNGDANLPRIAHLEESDVYIEIATQLKADQET
uniref:Uncharacterized protein n=1 Tax=Romanomermis culicivorax TaxID=13658 RepID=A0A915JC19_ROMCU